MYLVCVFVFFRSKDYTAPVNFVSAGLRKTAAEEKQNQQKGEGDSDDSDGDGPSAPSPPRGTAPKKLQMVNSIAYDIYLLLQCVLSYVQFCENNLH